MGKKAYAIAVGFILTFLTQASHSQILPPAEQLGKSIFYDSHLSINQNQSCASCHAMDAGWAGPSSGVNLQGAVYEGSIPGRFGNRKQPSAAYASLSPILYYDGSFVFHGGNFWDGRATGERLGNPTADLIFGPLLNPLMQALPDSACAVYRVCVPVNPGDYPVSFQEVWGAGTCDIAWPADIETACATEGGTVSLAPGDRLDSDKASDWIALSVAKYLNSAEVNRFSSKFDRYLDGEVQLSDQESLGLNLFKTKGGCSSCHSIEQGSGGEPPLLTNFEYANIGTPKNPKNPFYDMLLFNPQGDSWVDEGLGGFLASRGDYSSFASANMGKHKIPTLRNVDLRSNLVFVKAYSHNGYFKSLKQIVHFLNTRDVLPACGSGPFEEEGKTCWPLPEISQNINTADMGNLSLSHAEEEAIVAFLETLSDGWHPLDEPRGGDATGKIAVPAMNRWGLIVFTVLAGLSGLLYMRRNRLK